MTRLVKKKKKKGNTYMWNCRRILKVIRLHFLSTLLKYNFELKIKYTLFVLVYH